MNWMCLTKWTQKYKQELITICNVPWPKIRNRITSSTWYCWSRLSDKITVKIKTDYIHEALCFLPVAKQSGLQTKQLVGNNFLLWDLSAEDSRFLRYEALSVHRDAKQAVQYNSGISLVTCLIIPQNSFYLKIPHLIKYYFTKIMYSPADSSPLITFISVFEVDIGWTI
jgi:hypothetical protein